MSKNLWGTTYLLRPAEQNAGAGIAQDYFGFHVDRHRTHVADGKVIRGADAEELAEATERRRLNEGKIFLGTIAHCVVKQTRLIVGRHDRLGLCAYVDELTSHADNKIVVLSSHTKVKNISTREEFFGHLLVGELGVDDIEAVCRSYLKFHIQMQRS
jgi:hypothetical protein